MDESKKYIFSIMISYVIHDKYPTKVHAFSAWVGDKKAHTSSFKKLGFVSTSKSPIIFFLSDEGKELLENCPTLDFTCATSDNI